ncbi:MAG: hypothetical protein ABIJ03_03945 [Patescibacteria group bacterium]
MADKKVGGSFHPLGTLFDDFKLEDRGGYITREFQDFGLKLAVDLDDMDHKSLYIKMAKETPRVWLEQARSFVMDAGSARSRGRLFMWKLKQIKQSQAKIKDSKKSMR